MLQSITMSNIQIESDLKEILNKLDQKLDNIENKFEQKLDNIDNKFEQKLDHLQKDVTDINLRLTKVETKLDSTVEDIKEIKGSQKAQICDAKDAKLILMRSGTL